MCSVSKQRIRFPSEREDKKRYTENHCTSTLGICLLIFIAFSAIVNFFVMVRRLHDAGKPGFLAPVFYVAAFMIRLMPQTSQAFDVYFAFWLFMMFMLCARTKEPTHLEKKSE